VKRLVLVALAAACAKGPQTPFDKHVRRQLGGDAVIERSDISRAAYLAHRDERMDFELDANGNLTRTEFEIPGEALPDVVRAAVPLKRVYKARVRFKKDGITFWITNNDDMDWTVDVNGKILDHSFQSHDIDDE